VQLAERREKMAEAGGQMLTAAFSLLSQMLPGAATAPHRGSVDD
jgi:hypothetical protein